MAKNSMKPILCVALLLCIAGAILNVTYGLIFISSDVSHEDIQYEVTLLTSVVNSEITVKATVTNNDSPVAGINVDFYCSYNGGDWAIIESQLTDANGDAQATYTATANGGFDFKAIATVP